MTPRFAWPQYRHPLTLTVGVIGVDGDDPGHIEVDHGRRRINLETATSWSTLNLTVELDTTETAPAGIADVRAYALISSIRTNTRIPIQLDASDNGFVGSTVLERGTVGGAVTLLGHVVDDTARVVGAASPWALIVDASVAPTPPGAPPVDMVWADFAADEAPSALRAAKDSYSVLSFDEPKPVLYLNSGIKGMQQILGSASTKPERRRLRDTLGTAIARQALAALFREAHAQVVVEGNDVDLPDDPLLRQVCTTVADAMGSVASAEQLFLDLHDAVKRRGLSTELDHAFDTLTDHSATVAGVLDGALYAT